MRAEAQAHIDQINAATALLRRFLDWDRAQRRLEELNAKVEDPALWDDPKAAQEVMRERRRLDEAIGATQAIERELADTVELIEMAEAEGDEAMVDDGVRSLAELAERAERDKVAALLAGEADANNAYIEVNAGAGGTESQDWAEMLQRMYTRWAERHGLKVELIDHHAGRAGGDQVGDPAGQGRERLRQSQDRKRRPPAGADQPLRQQRRGATPASPASGSIPRSTTTSTSRSTRRTCGSTPIARRAPAGSTSTPPTARCASPTCRPGSSSPARTSARSTRTAPRR